MMEKLLRTRRMCVRLDVEYEFPGADVMQSYHFTVQIIDTVMVYK